METPLLPTVLICDDEPLLVSALARALKRLGINSLRVTAPAELHETVLRAQPDLILLDVQMRDFDGRDLLAKLKKDPRTKDITVVMISAEPDQFVRHVCFKLGAQDYELKPFEDCFIRKVARLAQAKCTPAAA